MGNLAAVGAGIAASGVDAVAKGGSAQNMVKNFGRTLFSKATDDVLDVLGTAGGFSRE